jgi:Guanosine polyphosphate pyrophosphohydrolases/synthetases
MEKSANSVWQRMKDKEIPFEEVHDAFFARFIVDCPLQMEKIECWKVYAILTGIYRPNTARLRDWISLPKANGYESLHAVLMSKTGNWVEVQIRTARMQEIAEKGFAAYWKYKSDDQTESGFDEWLKKVKDLIANEQTSALEFVNSFKLDLFSDEIFVFTPKGDMISLPKGSTVLDLAYSIHSEIGNHSIAANVNNRLVQLDQELHTGDQVEIITSEAQHPQESWFDFLATAYAKSRLKIGIKDYRKIFREEGEKRLNQIMEKLGIELSKTNRAKIIEVEKLAGAVDLFYFVAHDKINEQTIKAIFKESSNSNNLMRYLTFGLLRNNPKVKEEKTTSTLQENSIIQ